MRPSPIPIDSVSGLPFPAILMARAAALFPSQSALARRLGITGSHVSRILKGVCGIGPTLCLQVADVLGESRIAVLRGCGHARLCERVYEQADPQPPNAPVRDAIGRLSDDDQRLICALAERLASTAQDDAR
jgi:transcriptional regulator with XRE-family HTH domain